MTELQSWANKMVKAYEATRQDFSKPVVVARPQSKSNPRHKYMVLQYHNGNRTCTCPGFVYRRRCKHLEIV